jgi:glucan phosphoethanolaminetransferase (alkaline phosphatase superfamily)
MAAFKKAFSNRPFIGATVLIVVLFMFEEFLFAFPQSLFFQSVIVSYPLDEMLITFMTSIGSFTICYLFVWSALGSARVFQLLYVFLFIASSLVQYGFWNAVQRFITPVDLRIAAATPVETWQGASVLFLDWRVILPVTVFVFFLWIFSECRSLKTSCMKFGYMLLSTIILSISYGLENRTIHETLNPGLSISSFYQTITYFLIDNMLPVQREIISYQHPGTPHDNIILVIDESIRGDHLSINRYGRKTTPFLEKIADTDYGFYNLGLAVSGATCSYPSNALLLTGVRPGLDGFEESANYPTLFQYAKAMGYRTYYMDAQTNSFWNGLTDDDLSYIDAWFKAIDFGDDFESDFRAADMIANIISDSSGNFIVLNKRGVHFLYEGNYPSEAGVWLPLPAAHTIDPELISNPYDNGILFNVNTFFERLLVNPGILETTTILYTSDHGQTLFENNVNWLHCNYTPQEATVPMILIGKNLPPTNDKYRASHANVLPTLLDLMNVPSGERAHTYAPSLFSQKENVTNNYFFFDGSLRLIEYPDL